MTDGKAAPPPTGSTAGEPRTGNLKIGIVVVAYNAASTLADTLNRIPAELLPRIAEIIISDDASHDETFDHARRWGAQASATKTTIVRHTKNLATAATRRLPTGWPSSTAWTWWCCCTAMASTRRSG